MTGLKRYSLVPVLMAIIALVAIVVPVSAAMYTWTGAGGDNQWSTPANWRGAAVAPSTGDDLIFPITALDLSNNNNIAAGTSFNSISLSGSGYTLSGNSLSVSGSITDTSAGSNTISLPITITGALPITVTDAGETLNMNDPISGPGDLTKAGAGTLILSGANTYTGTTTVSAGELLVNGVNTGTSAKTVSGGTLSGAGTIPGAVTVANTPLSKLRGGTGSGNAGTLTITGSLAFSGTSSALDVTSDGAGLSGASVSGPLTAPSGMTVNLLETMPAGTYTLISDTGTLPTTLPTLGTNACGKTPVFAWVAGTGLVITLYSVPTITSINPTSGPAVGTLVNITGTNFASVTGVTFGSNAATITAHSATTINMTAPAGTAGPVTVTVTTPGGTATTSYTYTDTTITTAAISGVTAPVTGATPVSTITDNGQYTGTVTWLPADVTFHASKVYTATITLTPDAGYTLTGVPANFFTVAGTSSSATNAANSGIVTAVFPATANPTPTPTPTHPRGPDASPANPSALYAPPLVPSSTISVNVGGTTPISSVTVTGTGINGLIVTSTEATGPGNGVSSPPGTVNEYMDITPAQYTTITGAQISFSVPQSWLDANHFTPQDIILEHNVGTGWQALPTTFVKSENGEVYFTATSPGFSRFAITGQANLTTSSQNPTSSPTVQTIGDLAKSTATEPPTFAPLSLTPTSTPVLPVTTTTPRAGLDTLPVIGALALCGVIFLFRKNGN